MSSNEVVNHQNSVVGTVSDPDGNPVPGARVAAIARRLRSEASLGEATTGADGRFRIDYEAHSATAGLVVRVQNNGQPTVEAVRPTGSTAAVDLLVPTRSSQFSRVHVQVAPLLDDAEVDSLTETDINHLAQVTGQDPDAIGDLVVAGRYATATGQPLERCYGAVRHGLPADPAALSSWSTSDIARAVVSAATAGDIGSSDGAAEFADAVRSMHVRVAVRPIDGAVGAASVGELIAAVIPDPEARERCYAAYLDRSGAASAFCAEMSEDAAAGHYAERLGLAFHLRALTGPNMPLIRELLARFDSGEFSEPRDLVRLNGAWTELVEQTGGVPEHVRTGLATDGDHLADYARELRRRLIEEYPTAHIAYEMSARVEHAQSPSAQFLTANPDFDIVATPVNAETVPDEHARPELAEIQRTFKIARDFDAMQALRDNGFDSAQAVATLGRDMFARKVSDTLDPDTADAVHDRATLVVAAASNLVADFRSAGQFEVPWLPSFADPLPDTHRLPDWEELFGSADYGTFAASRSMYGQPAYFVDLLYFLRRLGGGNSTDEGPVAKALYARRPDLWDVELSDDNTDLSVPYVDLVNELLESAVVPDAPIPAADRQSSGDQASLRIQPQHVNPAAYDKLRVAVYPWDLPFDLFGTQTDAYLAHAGVARVALLETLGAAPDAPNLLNDQRLGLNPIAAQLIAGESLTPPRTIAECYGKSPDTDLVGVLRNVRALLDAGSLRYEELTRLLDTRFVNPGGIIHIKVDVDHPYDTTRMTVVGLDITALDRLHRFVRLQRALGWTAPLLDRVIVGCTRQGVLDRQALDAIAGVRKLASRLDLSIEQVLTFYNVIDTARYRTDTELPFYDQLFLDPAVVTATPNPFALRADRTELAVLGSLTAPEIGVALLAVLQVTDKDRVALITGPRAVTPNQILNLANLSALVRTVTLARALALSIPDLLRLIELYGGGGPFPAQAGALVAAAMQTEIAGGDPILPPGLPALPAYPAGFEGEAAGGAPMRTPSALDCAPVPPAYAQTLVTERFLDALDVLRDADLSVQEVDAVLTASLPAEGGIVPEDTALAATLTALRAALQAVYQQTAQTLDERGELTAKHLTLFGWDTALAEAAVSTLLGTVTYTATLKSLPDTVVFPPHVPVRFSATDEQLIFTGPMTDDQRTALRKVFTGAEYLNAVEELHRAPRRFVETRMKARRLPVFAANQPTMPADYQMPKALIGKVFYDRNDHMLKSRGYLSQADAEALKSAPSGAAIAAAVDTLLREQEVDIVGANKFLDAEVAKAFFDHTGTVPADRFRVVLSILNPLLRRMLSEITITQQLGQATGLDPATADVLFGTWLRSTSSSSVLNDFLVPEFVSSDPAVAVTRFAFGAQFVALSRIYRIGLVLSRVRVTAAELPFVFRYAGRAGWVDFNELPSTTIVGRAPLFGKFIRFLELMRLRAMLPGGVRTLDQVFTVADGPAPTTADVIGELAARTGWDTTDLTILAELLGHTTARGFLDVAAMRGVHAAVRMLLRLGVTADRLDLWIHANVAPAAAEAAWQAAKAKHPLAEWSVAAAPMQDAIRERQRAALVSYLVANPLLATDRIVVPEWTDANGIHDYFLLDVETGATQQTTRMAQAIYSIQLFVQRCLLNLEPAVTTSDTQLWKQWEWMQQYRLWEANQKVFLYPENYFEPDLRPDKTPFFLELESELQQRELTDDNVTTSVHHYLEKLDEVARLHPCGTYHDERTGKLYVFARNESTPRTYYFRIWVNRTFWTAWEKIDLDIGSDTLIPVVWDDRLYLFWPTFTKAVTDPAPVKTLPNGDPLNEMKPPAAYLQIHLNWSAYTKDGWQAKKVSETYMSTRYNDNMMSGVFDMPDLNEAISSWYFFQPEFTANGDLSIVVTLNRIYHAKYRLDQTVVLGVVRGWFYLHGRRGMVDVAGPTLYVENNNAEGRAKLERTLLPGGPIGASPFNNEFGGSGSLRVLDTRPGHSAEADVFKKIANYSDYRVLYPRSPELNWATFYMLYCDQNRAYTLEVTDPDPATQAWLRVGVFYHPYVETLLARLRFQGFDAMAARDMQLVSGRTSGAFVFESDANYGDNPGVLRKPYPDEEIDFAPAAAYSQYNWELFFDTPLLLAERLSTNQKFAAAQKWFHRIFDPTDRSGLPAPQRYWLTKPFFQTSTDPAKPGSYYHQRIEMILARLAKGDVAERNKVIAWLDNPFQPDIVARLRTTAYQKAVVMKYLDNLIAWGDQLFRQDTGESINEATQLYLLAAELLGRRPEEVLDPTPGPARSFRAIATVPTAANPLVLAEHLVGVTADRTEPAGITVGVGMAWFDYFKVPRNEKLLGYWDIVEDRLSKIRSGRNLHGTERALARFGAVIDPSLLVRAIASGLDLSVVLDDINAPVPRYRFGPMLAKAKELAGEVKQFGAALLSALEKRDAEAIARLRSSHERATLAAARLVRDHQIAEATDTLEAARKSLVLAKGKADYYSSREFMNAFEIAHTVLAGGALVLQSVAAGIHIAGSATSHLPDLKVGFPTTVGATYGGSNLSNSLQNLASSLGEVASILNGGAALAATVGGYRRRQDDWDFQADQAKVEIEQAEQQILAATMRLTIAETELVNHDLEIANAKEADRFLYEKFTNAELYDWMIGQLATSFFQTYQLAYDVAKRAERAYRHELGVSDSGFVNFGYWDTLHKGLLSGERLLADLNRMDAAYLDANAREFEMTKRISLAQLDAKALWSLKETGVCYVSLPEALFDLDAPGHYFRRIKNLSITVPCVVGPYTGVNLTATLTASTVRVDSRLSAGKYGRKKEQPHTDTRFRDYTGPIESIVTSTGQDDSGLFDTDLRDERFLPFEGMGAVSQWKLSLPNEFRQFDYSSITDVVLHMRYTARDGGATLGDAAVAEMTSALDSWVRGGGGRGLMRMFSVRSEFADQWRKFLATPAAGIATATFRLSKAQFPQLFRNRNYAISNPELVLVLSRDLGADGTKRFVEYYPLGAPLHATLDVGVSEPPAVDLRADPALGGLPRGAYPTIKDVAVKDTGHDWVVTAPLTDLDPHLLTTDGRLNPEAVLDLLLVCPFTLKGQN